LGTERYWGPLYHFLRRSYGKDHEEGAELTQAFFTWLLESGHLIPYDPARSGFRTFLKGILTGFPGHEPQALLRLKRGDGVKAVTLGGNDLVPPGPETDPDQVFEAVFLRDAVDRAVDRIRVRYHSGRRIVPFLAFEQYHLSREGPPPTYALVGNRLGIDASDVRNYLQEVRQEVRIEVRAEFEADGGGIPDEVATLFK
jgi:hypothetical protein